VFSNVAKLFFSLLSSNYNGKFKNANNPDAFPFELSKNDLAMVKESLDASAKDIPTHFNSTFKGVNFPDSRALYRSVEWTEHFLYSAPALISPRLKDS
jgi:hypothetical protein